jgi:hypothetical protein
MGCCFSIHLPGAQDPRFRPTGSWQRANITTVPPAAALPWVEWGDGASSPHPVRRSRASHSWILLMVA